MRQFEFYEFVGVLAPGAFLLYGLSLLFPQAGPIVQGKEVTFGDLGIFVLLAYVAGQLIQALGNAIEWTWWRAWNGWPSDWPRSDKHHLLSVPQREQLLGKVRNLLALPAEADPFQLPPRDWMAVVREIDATIQAAGRSKRVEAFNGNYGLNRGLVASLAALLALTLAVHGVSGWKADLLLSAGTAIALFRMHRFGRHYARELFVQFLSLPSTTAGAPLS